MPSEKSPLPSCPAMQQMSLAMSRVSGASRGLPHPAGPSPCSPSLLPSFLFLPAYQHGAAGCGDRRVELYPYPLVFPEISHLFPMSYPG
jgi:hypothetical protein